MESIKGYKGSKITSEDINKLLREAVRNIEERTNREKRAEEEARENEDTKAGNNSKGHSRKRRLEKDEGTAGEPKTGRRHEDKREEEEELALMEAAEAAEEAEASMCELEEDMDWEDKLSQGWPEPAGSSTPRAGECKEGKTGKGEQEKAKRKLPLVIEDKIIGTKSEELRLHPVVKMARLVGEEGRAGGKNGQIKKSEEQQSQKEGKRDGDKARCGQDEEEYEIMRIVKRVREEKRRMEEKRKKQESSGEGNQAEEGKNGDGNGRNKDRARTGAKGRREETRSEEERRKEGWTKDRRGEGNRSDVVVIVQYPREEIDYWSAIRWLKTKIHAFTDGLKEIRETRKGDVIIILQRDNEDRAKTGKECAEVINREGNGKWKAQIHTDRVVMAIKISDPDLEKDELMEALKKGGLEELVEKGEICFKHIGGRQGTCHRTAFLECTRTAAKRLTQEKSLRTKWQELRPFFPRRKQEECVRGKEEKKGGETRGISEKTTNGEGSEKRQPKPGTSKDPWISSSDRNKIQPKYYDNHLVKIRQFKQTSLTLHIIHYTNTIQGNLVFFIFHTHSAYYNADDLTKLRALRLNVTNIGFKIENRHEMHAGMKLHENKERMGQMNMVVLA
nr:PREDICTED: myosin-14-like [Megachile rotundata]